MSAKKILLLLSSAFALGLAANFPQALWWTSFFSLGIFIFFVEQEEGSYGKTFLKGSLFGTFYMLTVLSYFWFAFPLDWAGIDSRVFSFLVLFLIWVITSLPLGFGIGLWSLSFRYLHREGRVLYNLFLGAFLWALCEYIRAYGFSFVYIGDGTTVGPHWTFGFLGYPVAFSSLLLPLASVGGVWILSFVAFAISYGASRLLKLAATKTFSRNFVIGTTIFALFVGVSLVSIPRANRPQDGEIDVALVSMYAPAAESHLTKDEAEFEHMRALLSNQEALMSADLLVLSEYADFLSVASENPGDVLEGVVSEDAVVIDSRIEYVDNTTKQAVLRAYSQSEGYEGEYRKRLLTPTGEYLPAVVAAGAELLGQGEWVTFFNNTRGYRAGEGTSLFRMDDTTVGILFCIEILSPEFYRNMAQGGANVLINTASHSNFPGSKTLINQNISMAKVRAVESGRYYAQSTSYGPAFVVSNSGEVVARTDARISGVLFETIPAYMEKTLYAKYGRAIPYIAALGALFFLIANIFVKKQK